MIAFTVAALASPIQILVGDVAARRLIDAQRAKFAAMELIPEGGSNVALTIGGIYRDGEVVGAIEVPGLASFLGTATSTASSRDSIRFRPTKCRPSTSSTSPSR